MIPFACLLFICFSSCKEHDSENTLSENFIATQEKLPHDFMFMQRAYPTGQLKPEAYREAVQWKRANRQSNGGNAVWEFTGPVNIGGRITDIEIPIDDAATYYVGAASGGIFKTTDSGANWNPIFDEQEMLSIGDIEISRNNTDVIWVGTGEVNAGGGSLAYDGDGIYKSEDGGLTWESKGLPNVGSIGKVLIHPSNENTIIVGAMGPLFRNDTNRGVYKTTNGGATWEQTLFVSDSTGIIDMAIHPSNGNLVYAASWERIRRPDRRQYGGETSGLWRSTDGGDNWTEMTNGLPTNPADKGRISIDISQSNPDVLVARYADAGGSIQGVYRSQDGGDTWQARNSSQLANVGFHWWFRGIFIDPNDEDILYNVDFTVDKSTDGGVSWFPAFNGVHVDQHALAFNNLVAGEVLLGNDGGLYYSGDDGASFTKDLSLPITQFYRFHVDAQNANKIYGGTQDNSTMRTTTGSLDDWEIISGGDGFQPLVDPSNTNVIYTLSQFGNLRKSTDNAMSSAPALNGINGGDPRNWDTPITFDPNNSQTLFYGTNRVYKTTNAAGVWSAISPDLSNGTGTGNLVFGTIISISVSPLNSDVIYAGTDDGNVWVTQDGGSNWNNVSSNLPNRWVTKVEASHFSASEVFVTFSGYRYGEDNGHVFSSTDFGTNWNDITNNLPDIPLNDILQDNFGVLYVASDVGVFGSNDNGASWQTVGGNLPSVVVTDMHFDADNDELYAATYGRSSYKIDVSSNVLDVDHVSFSEGITLSPNPATEVTTLHIASNSQAYKVIIFDAMGREVKRFPTSEAMQHELSLNGLNSGIYYVSIVSGHRKAVKKLIIK